MLIATRRRLMQAGGLGAPPAGPYAWKSRNSRACSLVCRDRSETTPTSQSLLSPAPLSRRCPHPGTDLISFKPRAKRP